MEFAVFHDILKAGEIKIHRIDCYMYTKRDLAATTTEWFTVSDYDSAKAKADSLAKKDGINYRDCKICASK